MHCTITFERKHISNIAAESAIERSTKTRGRKIKSKQLNHIHAQLISFHIWCAKTNRLFLYTNKKDCLFYGIVQKHQEPISCMNGRTNMDISSRLFAFAFKSERNYWEKKKRKNFTRNWLSSQVLSFASGWNFFPLVSIIWWLVFIEFVYTLYCTQLRAHWVFVDRGIQMKYQRLKLKHFSFLWVFSFISQFCLEFIDFSTQYFIARFFSRHIHLDFIICTTF